MHGSNQSLLARPDGTFRLYLELLQGPSENPDAVVRNREERRIFWGRRNVAADQQELRRRQRRDGDGRPHEPPQRLQRGSV